MSRGKSLLDGLEGLDVSKIMALKKQVEGQAIPPAIRISKEQERLDAYQTESQLELLYKDIDQLRKERDRYRQALQDAGKELANMPGVNYHYHTMHAQLIIEKGLGV